jgi:hypothetical protein
LDNIDYKQKYEEIMDVLYSTYKKKLEDQDEIKRNFGSVVRSIRDYNLQRHRQSER